ncbi:transcriptional regulator [Rhodoferax lacus]|uniref:Transcriptional regulator n=1 Tax=Rhodoferax lacus TaxID=2184758 RepID=A0A3E1RFU2_9BURK|nr:LacI family DNA-binding transcriptional regulator [Rhodoferax lacus]RFO98238.1 transcriptional regulator [Rhodoferax lacus]
MKNPSAKRSTKEPVTAQSATVTLDMVAREAGVSPATVSRIMNGTAVVSAARKEAVDAAIAKLGFVPNPVARGLAGGRTFSIGVVTQTLDSPFYGSALRGIEEKLLPLGYSPLFVSGQWNAEVEAKCMDVLRSRRVDGIIVLTGRLTDKALKNYAKTMPIVVTGRKLSAPGLAALYCDNVEGARLATQHLIGLGHRQIAFISGDPQHPDAAERFQGYRKALEEARIKFDPALVAEGGFYEASGLQAVGDLLASRKRFTAIFAANDQMAVGAALGLSRHSLRVPEDVSLIGYDDLLSSLYSNPPLSSVHQSAYELGQLAADVLLQLLSGEKPVFQVPAPRLVPRESCRRLAV